MECFMASLYVVESDMENPAHLIMRIACPLSCRLQLTSFDGQHCFLPPAQLPLQMPIYFLSSDPSIRSYDFRCWCSRKHSVNLASCRDVLQLTILYTSTIDISEYKVRNPAALHYLLSYPIGQCKFRRLNLNAPGVLRTTLGNLAPSMAGGAANELAKARSVTPQKSQAQRTRCWRSTCACVILPIPGTVHSTWHHGRYP
jgi:hypothetical protein